MMMAIPDSVIGAGVTMALTVLALAAKQFIREQSSRTETATTVPEADIDSMSVRQLRKLEALFEASTKGLFPAFRAELREELNGRYLLATEARQRFDRMEQGLQRLDEYVRANQHDLRNRFPGLVADAVEVAMRERPAENQMKKSTGL